MQIKQLFLHRSVKSSTMTEEDKVFLYIFLEKKQKLSLTKKNVREDDTGYCICINIYKRSLHIYLSVEILFFYSFEFCFRVIFILVKMPKQQIHVLTFRFVHLYYHAYLIYFHRYNFRICHTRT